MPTKTMLIESDPHQTRIAILEDGALVELFFERPDDLSLVGNIYRGRVNRVLPGMQAAFVDIGLERDAFLYVSEVVDPLSSQDDSMRPVELPPIADLLRPGETLTLQVLKDALPNKGARVSTQIALPGRYLVLLPGNADLGISRRIDDPEERARLSDSIAALRPEGCGLIVRTAAAGRDTPELLADLQVLERRWQRIRRRSETVSAPALIHRDLDLAERVVRDCLSTEFDVLRVGGEETWARIRAFVEEIEPGLAERVKLDAYDSTLFERFGIDRAVDAALEREVALASGGSIVIDPTEALVAIDVNTARFVGRSSLQETVLATNLEAVAEAARQIRLRNLGGIIVIDLIDMDQAEDRQRVFETLLAELAKDRAKSSVLPISEFGLVELTRKRNRPSLERQLTRRCPYCRGTGRVRNASTVCLEIRRQLLLARDRLRGGEVLLRVHPAIAASLQGPERPVLDELEQTLEAEVLLQSDAQLHVERFEIEG